MGNYLKTPIKEKEIEENHYDHLSYVSCSMQGWRISMEDSHITLPFFDTDTSLFCIFDGHGGDEVSKFCSNHFPSELKKNKNYKSKNYKKSLEETFQKIDKMLMSNEGQKELNTYLNREKGESYAGCTALVCLLVKKKLFVANSGDCRCLLFDKEGKIFIMNSEHKPNDVLEKERIIRAGGVIVNGRINENLNLSRALGDIGYKKNKLLGYREQIISGFPDVVVRELESRDFVVFMGCDGVFERLNDIEIRNFVFESLLQGDKLEVGVRRVLDETLAPGLNFGGKGYDNMSAVMITINK